MVLLISVVFVDTEVRAGEEARDHREGVKNVALSVTSVCAVYMQPGKPCPQREYFQRCEQDIVLRSITDYGGLPHFLHFPIKMRSIIGHPCYQLVDRTPELPPPPSLLSEQITFSKPLFYVATPPPPSRATTTF